MGIRSGRYHGNFLIRKSPFWSGDNGPFLRSRKSRDNVSGAIAGQSFVTEQQHPLRLQRLKRLLQGHQLANYRDIKALTLFRCFQHLQFHLVLAQPFRIGARRLHRLQVRHPELRCLLNDESRLNFFDRRKQKGNVRFINLWPQLLRHMDKGSYVPLAGYQSTPRPAR